MTVQRLPTRLRVVHSVLPFSNFARLDRHACGQFGWLSSAGALLLEPEEKGRVLLAVFDGQRPFLFRGRSAHHIEGMSPEAAIAAVCLRDGIATMGCGLYTRRFLSFESAGFFSHTGISRFFYATGRRHPDVVSVLVKSGAEVIRVSV